MLKKWIEIDFEYRRSHEARLELVCCALKIGNVTKSIWLHKDPIQYAKLKKFLIGIRNTHTLRCWSYDAEGRSLIALGLNPSKFRCIDLNAEYRMLTNHNDKIGYGQQMINGIIKKTYRKKYGDKKDKKAHDRTPTNLLSATYKLLQKGTKEDYDYKNKMRDLILDNDTYSTAQRNEILEYCRGDIGDLEQLYTRMQKEFKRLLNNDQYERLHEEQIYRANAVGRAAIIASVGYPVNREKLVNFVKNVPNIIKDMQEDINSQFPEMEIFRYTTKKAAREKKGLMSLNTKVVKKWIEESEYADRWARTPTKDFSLKLEAWEKFFSWRHDFPRDNFAAQFLRWLKLNQSLNGFKPKSVTAQNQDTFFSYYGSDDRAHPYLNAYGAQSARYQPKALGFLHLKASWMRSLVEPKPGRAICSIDYGSEEFLLAGLISEDRNMLDSYASGDVYLHFAKLAGAVPMYGLRKDYKDERDRFKSTVLGISYGMGPTALAAKLTMDTGKLHSVDDAKELIGLFQKAYPEYTKWVLDLLYTYKEINHIKLPCGWYMFKDNDNARSVANMPIQGLGSSILRKAIELAQDAGLTIILPLHDAAYCEFDSSHLSAVDLLESCMREAFAFYFKGEMKQKAFDLIRMDVDIWSPDFEDSTIVTPGGLTCKAQKIYIDPRSKSEFDKFSKYFNEIIK